MKYNLFLDDFRSTEDAFFYTKNPMYNTLQWEIVRSYDEFVQKVLTMGIPDIVSFDHDLADEHYFNHDLGITVDYNDLIEKTGYHCAKWLIEFCIDAKKEIPRIILIHSMNIVGTKNIESLFRTYEKIHRGS